VLGVTDDYPRYVIDPLAPLPKRWTDHLGPIRILAEPAEGWVLARRRGAAPFALRVRTLLNTDRDPVHGPFTVVEKAKRK
jgi:hypothetical protein